MMDAVAARLPASVDLYTSIWEVHVTHEVARRRGDQSVELVIEPDEDSVLVPLVFERRLLQMRKHWTGSIKEAPSIILDWTTEMLSLRDRRAKRRSFEIDL